MINWFSFMPFTQSSNVLLAHTSRQRRTSVWQMTDALAFSFLCVATFISPAQTCCIVLIWTRNMNRCDMGNLSTWPRAMFGQSWAAELSLKLKSSSGGLTEAFVGNPKGIICVWSTMASKQNFLFFAHSCCDSHKKGSNIVPGQRENKFCYPLSENCS